MVNFSQAFENCRGRDTLVADGTDFRHNASHMLLILNNFTSKLKNFNKNKPNYAKVNVIVEKVMFLSFVFNIFVADGTLRLILALSSIYHHKVAKQFL